MRRLFLSKWYHAPFVRGVLSRSYAKVTAHCSEKYQRATAVAAAVVWYDIVKRDVVVWFSFLVYFFPVLLIVGVEFVQSL